MIIFKISDTNCATYFILKNIFELINNCSFKVLLSICKYSESLLQIIGKLYEAFIVPLYGSGGKYGESVSITI